MRDILSATAARVKKNLERILRMLQENNVSPGRRKRVCRVGDLTSSARKIWMRSAASYTLTHLGERSAGCLAQGCLVLAG